MIYESRWDFIAAHVAGKRVLDIGPAELVGTSNRRKLDRWIHGKVVETAAETLGLESSEEQVRALRAMGYNVLHGDAQDFSLNRTFEVVLAGELIEHLSNPGSFLDCVRRHLEPGGRLVLTTPNRLSLLATWRVLRTGGPPRYDKPIDKHVAYFDSASLEALLERHGFSGIESAYCKWVGAPSRGSMARLAVTTAARVRPALLPTLVATATR